MGLPPTEPREYCRPAVRLRVVGGSGGNGSLAGTESILASCHESSRSKTFTRTQSRCMAPLTLNLSASMVARRDTAGPSRDRRGGLGRVPVASATGNRSSAQPDRTGRKGKGVPGRCGSLSLFSYSVYGAMAAPPAVGSGGSNFARGRATARAAVDGRCRGWSADHAPRSAAVFAPLSRALFTAPHTAPL